MVLYNATNTTGWTELQNGDMINAAFQLFADTAYFGGWFVCILFFVYHLMLLIKTKSITLAFITGIFFASLYAISSFVEVSSVYVIFTVLVFELAGILYMWWFK